MAKLTKMLEPEDETTAFPVIIDNYCPVDNPRISKTT